MEDTEVPSDVEDELVSSSEVVDEDKEALVEETSDPIEGTSSTEQYDNQTIKRTIPPPGAGQTIYDIDSYLIPYREHLEYRLDSLSYNTCLHQ